MKFAVEIGSVAMTYIPSFIKIGRGIQKLIERDSQTHRGYSGLTSPLLFFQNKESRLKRTHYVHIKSVCPSVTYYHHINRWTDRFQIRYRRLALQGAGPFRCSAATKLTVLWARYGLSCCFVTNRKWTQHTEKQSAGNSVHYIMEHKLSNLV
jgi:hypothetical protein